MQFIFLIWPILLLPVFVTWLTRPRPLTSLPPRSSASRRVAVKPLIAPSAAARKPVRQLSAAEHRRQSPAYRRAAVQAYENMLALEMDEHDESDDDASAHVTSLQGKDATSSRS